MTLTWRHAFPALILAIATVLFFGLRVDRALTFDRLIDGRETLQDFVGRHHTLALLAYVAVYTLVVAIAVPGGTLLTVTGGFLFGAGVGAPCAALAATTGAAILFLAARTVLNDFEPRTWGGAVARIRGGFRRSAWSYMLFLRLTPLCPFWLVNLAAASSGIPLHTFVWTTAVGILPATFVFAAAGENLDNLATAGQAAREACRAAGDTACQASLPWQAILSPAVLVTLIALSLLALAPVGLRGWRERGRATTP